MVVSWSTTAHNRKCIENPWGFFQSCSITIFYSRNYYVVYYKTKQQVLNILSCEFEFMFWQGLFNITLCSKVCPWLAAYRWFSPGTLVSSSNKTESRYSWNIVESGIKHHNPNPIKIWQTNWLNAINTMQGWQTLTHQQKLELRGL